MGINRIGSSAYLMKISSSTGRPREKKSLKFFLENKLYAQTKRPRQTSPWKIHFFL